MKDAKGIWYTMGNRDDTETATIQNRCNTVPTPEILRKGKSAMCKWENQIYEACIQITCYLPRIGPDSVVLLFLLQLISHSTTWDECGPMETSEG
jgi:hypothetical protein